jgi:hypothetical protein
LRPIARATASPPLLEAHVQHVAVRGNDTCTLEVVGKRAGIPCYDASLPGKEAAMAQREYLVWIDLEMTGLMPDTDQIIEIATVVTDKNLNVTAEGPELAIHQPEAVLARMDAWNQRQHGGSGLLARVRSSRMTWQRPSDRRSCS